MAPQSQIQISQMDMFRGRGCPLLLGLCQGLEESDSWSQATGLDCMPARSRPLVCPGTVTEKDGKGGHEKREAGARAQDGQEKKKKKI